MKIIINSILLVISLNIFANINELYQKAKEGDVESQLKLAEAYYYGKDIDVDLKLAFYWYKQAANRGDVNAQLSLADFYYNGIGTVKNITNAKLWYKKAANKDNAMAFHSLANILHYDDKNVIKALELYKRAADLGYKPSQIELGDIYSKAQSANSDQSNFWYNKANIDKTAQQKKQTNIYKDRSLINRLQKQLQQKDELLDQIKSQEIEINKKLQNAKQKDNELKKQIKELLNKVDDKSEEITKLRIQQITANKKTEIDDNSKELVKNSKVIKNVNKKSSEQQIVKKIQNINKDNAKLQKQLQLEQQKYDNFKKQIKELSNKNSKKNFVKKNSSKVDKLIKQNTPEADYQLAEIYLNGLWVDKDLQQAYYFAMKSLMGGNPQAQELLDEIENM